MRVLRLVMLGPPGAGKGTQARVLEERFGAKQISSGDLLRRHRSEGTPLGREAQSYMDSGALVPDALIIRMMEDELAFANAFLLDGFPRTVPQAQALDELLQRLNKPLSATLLFECDRAELIARLTARWTNPRTGRTYHSVYNPPKVAGIDDDDGCELVLRPDDTLEVVTKRLDTYEAQTQPLVAYYEAKGLLARIDAMRPVEMVTETITAALEDGALI